VPSSEDLRFRVEIRYCFVTEFLKETKMEILNRRSVLALSGAAALAPLARPAWAGASSAEVFTADPAGALVDSVVILGDQAAVLVDAQINLANAGRLVGLIQASGRTLETVLISHAHPDHYLGLEAILAAFPAARVLTPAPVRDQIAAMGQGTLDFLTSTAPAGTFASRVILPDALEADHILLEGERIDILPPMRGDTALVSAVHVPVLDTLIVADFAYADTHAWMAETLTPEALEGWRASLTMLEAIGAGTVIPGHRLDTSASDASVCAKTRAYLDRWETARAATTTADDLRAAMAISSAKVRPSPSCPAGNRGVACGAR
jgi:glyoxylase-like metal-dependent hydrolase (beta-lactamase superfamily II)